MCPEPSADRGGGKSADAIAYQNYIGTLVNGAPLPPGMGVSLINPVTGAPVVFDHCIQSTGTMVEAKGPGYEAMLDKGATEFPWLGVQAGLIAQTNRQTQAAQGRAIEWHFAEQNVADYTRQLFRDNGFGHIIVLYSPMAK